MRRVISRARLTAGAAAIMCAAAVGGVVTVAATTTARGGTTDASTITPAATESPTPTTSATPSASPTPTATATASASAAPPPKVTRLWLTAFDNHRWTVSYGHVLAHSRTLRTLVLQPGTPGPHPLVIFCHGFDITPTPYLHMLTHWARAGFVVAAPYFPLTRPGAGRWLDEDDIVHQPRDVSVVITAVEQRLGRAVDPHEVVVAGHSDGGATAFAVGYANRLRDPRVIAVMVFSGDRWSGVGGYSAPARMLPVLLVQSDRDEFNSVHSAAQVWAVPHRPKAYLHLHGARHLAPFTGACAWRPIVEAVTTDFLRAWTTRSATTRARQLAGLDEAADRTGLSRATDLR